MSSVEFSPDEIQALAEKLDRLELTDKEHALLSAIIEAAGPPTRTHHEHRSIRDQFIAAFKPGKLGEPGPRTAAIKIGSG